MLDNVRDGIHKAIHDLADAIGNECGICLEASESIEETCCPECARENMIATLNETV